MTVKSSKYLAIAFVLITVLTGFTYAQSITVDAKEWREVPEYMEDAKLNLVHSDTVQTKTTEEVCVDYNQTSNGSIECLDTENQTVPDENVQVLEFRNTGFEYLGNGDVRITFDARVNQELVGPISSEKFKDKYLLNGAEPNQSEYEDFTDGLTSVSFGTLGGKVKDRRISGDNVNSGWQDMQFVIGLQNFSHGGVSLSDYSGLRLDTSVYSGGGRLR